MLRNGLLFKFVGVHISLPYGGLFADREVSCSPGFRMWDGIPDDYSTIPGYVSKFKYSQLEMTVGPGEMICL